METLLSLIASGATVLGAIVLHRRWREREGGSALMAFAGWALWVAALAIWIGAFGTEFGSVLGLVVPTVAVLLVIAFHADFRRREDALENRQAGMPSVARIAWHHLVFLLAVPVAGVTSLLLAATIALSLPWHAANQWALAIFAFPVFWGVLATWVTFDRRLLRPACAVVGIALVSAGLLYTNAPGVG